VILPTRWRKVARDLVAHKVRTALVVLSIAVGIFAILVVMGGRGILLETFDANFAKSHPPTATLYTTDFQQILVDRVRRAADISDAEGRRDVTLRYRAGDVSKVTEPPPQVAQAARAKSIQIVAEDDWALSRLSRVMPESGTQWPPPRGGIVLERAERQVADLAVGSLITVYAEDGSKHVLRVSGFAHDINAFPAMFTGRIEGFVTMQTMGDIGEPKAMNELLVYIARPGLTRAEASRIVSRVRDDVVAPTGIATFGTNVPEPGSHQLGDIFRAVALLLLALGVMALALSAFLVVNTVSALLAQQMRQLGIMKAIGARSAQVTGMYLATVTAYGVLAVVVGLPVGAVFAAWFASYGGALLDFGPGPSAPPLYALGLAAVVGLIVPLAAAWIPVRAGTRTSVVSALNSTGIGSTHFGHGLTDRLLGRLRGLPRPVALSLRNTFLRKGRLAMTLATLILASAVVMGVGSVQASIGQTVSDIGKWWNHDVEVTFARPVSSQVAERQAAKVNGVIGTETWVVSPATLKRGDGTENSALSVVGLPPKTTYVTPTLVAGHWLRPGEADAIVLDTDVVRDEPTLGVGADITLNVRGVDHTFHVVGIVGGQMMGPTLFTDEAGLDRILALHGGITRVVVRTATHTKADQDAAADRLERMLKDAGLPVSGVRTSTGIATNVSSQLGILVTFLVIMAAILAIVGVIGLTGTMIINVLESTREIGVMRAIGASHGSIYQVFVTEGVVVGLLSWIGGVILSAPLSYGLVKLLEGAIAMPLSYAFSWPAVGGWLLVVTAISALASLLPAFNASQVSVRDAIAYE
jgi:putative ABC transport system permease protein